MFGVINKWYSVILNSFILLNHLYAIVNGASGFVVTDDGGYILVLCDKNGIAKTIVQGLSDEEKTNIIDSLKSDNVEEYYGEVSLPV